MTNSKHGTVIRRSELATRLSEFEFPSIRRLANVVNDPGCGSQRGMLKRGHKAMTTRQAAARECMGGDVVTLYIGDDQTDEDAFRVLKETDQGACLYALGACSQEMGIEAWCGWVTRSVPAVPCLAVSFADLATHPHQTMIHVSYVAGGAVASAQPRLGHPRSRATKSSRASMPRP
eukprot:356295-Pelagomonas_calceolata.AAC.4